MPRRQGTWHGVSSRAVGRRCGRWDLILDLPDRLVPLQEKLRTILTARCCIIWVCRPLGSRLPWILPATTQIPQYILGALPWASNTLSRISVHLQGTGISFAPKSEKLPPPSVLPKHGDPPAWGDGGQTPAGGAAAAAANKSAPFELYIVVS